MLSAARTRSACLASAVRRLRERETYLTDFCGQSVKRVAPHAGGIAIHFSSGATIVVPRGVITDAAGLPVVEPAPASTQTPGLLAPPQPGEPAAAASPPPSSGAAAVFQGESR